VRLYIDSCVYVDFLGIPKTDLDEVMSVKASKFFCYILQKGHKILLSGWVVKETEKILSNQNITWESLKPFFSVYNNLIEPMPYTKEDQQKAKELYPSNYDDALHVILAEKSKADYIITSNITHFNAIKTAIPILRPSEFLSRSL